MNDTPPEEQTKQIGKGMIIIAWVLIFGMLIWFFGVLEKNKRNPNQNVSTHVLSSGEKEVVLESGSFGHYVASGKINNTEVTFLVDTGASYVSVPESVAKKAGLGITTEAPSAMAFFATTLNFSSRGWGSSRAIAISSSDALYI